MNTQKLSRRRFIVSGGSALLVGVAGCSSQQTDPSSTDTATPTSPPKTTDQSEPATSTSTATTTPNEAEGAGSEQTVVQMITDNKGSYFDPKGLLIEPGTTVRFVNASGSHSTTAYHPDNDDMPLRIPEDATAWDSGIYTNAEETFEHTFDVEGVYDYYCTPHEMLGMVGRIVVGTPQDGPGTMPPEDLPPAAKESLPSIDTILEKQVVSGP